MTTNQLSGRATGALFFTGFGALWLLLGFYCREQLNPGTVIGVVLIVAGLALGAFHLMRDATRWPQALEGPAFASAFRRINAIQWIAAFAVAFALGQIKLSAYIPAAVAMVVGLHLLPLARLFRYRPHVGTGLALVAWGAGACIFVPADRLEGVTALGAGAILWCSAAITLALAFDASQNAPGRTIVT